MTKLYISLLALLALATGADAKGNLFPYATRARYKAPFAAQGRQARRSAAADKTFSCGDAYGYLNGPKGATWFYTVDYTTTEHEVVGGYGQTESEVTGYTVTVYDDTFTPVGTVADTITLPQGATAVAQVMVDPTVTQKFFNIDTNYELILSLIYNNPDYSLTYESKIYSVGHEGVVTTLPGYCVDAVDAAADAWSENFYLTFITEVSGNIDDYDNLNDYAASCRHRLTTYKKAGWSEGPAAVNTVEIAQGRTPGSESNVPFFASVAHDGKAYFFTQEYEKPFFVDPTGTTGDESATADNRLLVNIYSLEGYATQFQTVQQTAIPMAQPTDQGTLYNFYGIGELDFTADFLREPQGWAFLVTVEGYQSSTDECLDSYYIYNADGTLRTTLAEKTSGAQMLSDIVGQPRQAMFITLNDDGTDHTFHFIDLTTDAAGLTAAEAASEIPQTIGDVELTGYLDRTPVGDSYQYCAQLNGATADSALNTYDHVGWLRPDGTVDHVDLNNLGPRIAIAQAYISGPALSPYTFNGDSEREYMYLVKRYIGDASSSQTEEELLVVNPRGDRLLQLGPQADKGNLQLITLLIAPERSQLITTYNKEYHYTAEVRDLPLTRFEQGGDGTAQNPYLIATVGDLQQMRSNLSAHYRLAADIDATGYTFTPISGTFTGELDGDGHVVANLTLAGSIFNDMGQGGTIKNITFQQLTGGNLCGAMLGAHLSDVHVSGLTATLTGDDSFGGLATEASLGSTIDACSVLDATITAEGGAAGIVGTLRTGSKVTACAFTGRIEAGTEVGGIVGTTVSGDERIEDCHVRASLVAKNTVGGILGSSRRSLVARCLAEGTIEATANTQAWADNGPQAGGIVGRLEPGYEKGDTTIVVRDCYAALTSLTGYTPAAEPDYATQHQTIHRICGSSRRNAEPDIIDYDSDWNPVYDAPNAPEQGFQNNYAALSLALADDGTLAADSTAEGASLPDEDFTAEWLRQTLVFAFRPWAETADGTIMLWYEQEGEIPHYDAIEAIQNTEFKMQDCYDLSGRRVLRPRHGIYIVNGHKIAL